MDWNSKSIIPEKRGSQSTPENAAPETVSSTDLLDALRKELRADAMRLCQKAQAEKGLEAMADMAVALAVTRVAECVERTLRSASNGRTHLRGE